MNLKQIKELKKIQSKIANFKKIENQKIIHDDVIQGLNISIYMDQDYNIEINLMDNEVDIQRYSFNDLLEFSIKINKMKNEVAQLKQAYIEKLMK
jgi:hypothetical protein